MANRILKGVYIQNLYTKRDDLQKHGKSICLKRRGFGYNK